MGPWKGRFHEIPRFRDWKIIIFRFQLLNLGAGSFSDSSPHLNEHFESLVASSLGVPAKGGNISICFENVS